MEAAERVFRNPLAGRGLSWGELSRLLEASLEILRGEPQLLELEGRVLVVGDTHGDLASSVKAIRLGGVDAYLFLGDYVDRGPYQLENINFLLAAKILNPDRVYLLRGNHESPLMNERYGFYSAVARSYGALYDAYVSVFSNLPYAAVIDGRVACLHGGVARGLRRLEDVGRLPKGDAAPSNRVGFEILWNDPDESVEDFAPSPRGPGVFLYGERPVRELLRGSGLEMLVRAHEYFPSGLRTFFDGLVVSVFSCRYYPSTTPKAVLVAGDWTPVSLD